MRAIAGWLLVFSVSCVASETRTITAHEALTSNVTIEIGDKHVTIDLDGNLAARIDNTIGATAAVPLEGRACTATVVDLVGEDGETEGAVRVACSDGPVPGSDTTERSARSIFGVLCMLPIIATGILTGLAVRYWAKTKKLQGLAMLAILATLGALVGIPLLAFRGNYVYGYLALGFGLATASYLAGASWRDPDAMSAWASVALLATIVVFALIVPRWSVAAPIGAFAVGSLVWFGVGYVIGRVRS
ncbi:MAG: hypothetical protein NT062_19115 [Proteobacteria bacterium]|nr:hypothetical protein [Pseudomonadota bacterium]